MSAKKKPATIQKDAKVIRKLREQLAATEEVAAAQHATMMDTAKVIVELNEALAASEFSAKDRLQSSLVVHAEWKKTQAQLAQSKEYAENLRQKLVAEERECDFWIDEAERFRDQVVELLRERAMRARPGDPS